MMPKMRGREVWGIILEERPPRFAGFEWLKLLKNK